MSGSDYSYVVRILFQVDGLVNNQLIRDMIDNRISIIESSGSQLGEFDDSRLPLPIYVASSHDSQWTKGLVEILSNNLEKSAFIAAAIEGIDKIGEKDAKFLLLEIEDIISTRSKTQSRAVEILTSYKFEDRIQAKKRYGRNNIESVLRKGKLLFPRSKFTLALGVRIASNSPLILALIMFIAAATLLMQGSLEDARIAAEYTFSLAAAGGIWKFIDYIRIKQRDLENNGRMPISS